MTAFDEKVEFLCREMCEELGINPDGEYNSWDDYDRMVREWLVNEAFSKVRGRYWNEEKYQEARAKKQIVKT